MFILEIGLVRRGLQYLTIFSQRQSEQRHLIKQFKIKLGNKKLNRRDWNAIFLKIQQKRILNNEEYIECYLERLYLSNNNRPQTIKQIQNISFSNLLKLDLVANKICNIEAISMLKILGLKQLLLYRNNITRTNSLSKWNFKQLAQLSIYDNKINQISNFYRMNSKTNRLWMQGQNFDVQTEDASFMAKVKKRQLQYQFGIRSIHRIHQPKVLDQIKNEHLQIKIFQTQNIANHQEIIQE